jgi:hypothetical protein
VLWRGGLTLPEVVPGAFPHKERPDRRIVVTGLGLTQILAWGSSYYLPAVFAGPIALETGWPLTWVISGLSLGLLVAGIVSPRVGRAINGKGGRPVLVLSSVLLGAGLAGLSFAGSLGVYFLAWLVIGIGMGAGLYDAGFATLGRLYGSDARRLIVVLTLFGGFASTVCWPLSAFLIEQFGWRGACLVYAGLHFVFALPLHALLVPSLADAPEEPGDLGSGEDRPFLVHPGRMPVFLLLAVAIALCSAISSIVSVHLLTFLQAGGLALASAVALGALVGPSQVGARVVEMVFGRYYHPIWTMLAATVLVTMGLGLLLIGFPIVVFALIFYGAGIGIESIARGTLPLALFGPKNYAALMGSLALPSLVAQSVSPSLAALLLQYGGSTMTLAVLTGTAALNAALVLMLWAMNRRAASRN